MTEAIDKNLKELCEMDMAEIATLRYGENCDYCLYYCMMSIFDDILEQHGEDAAQILINNTKNKQCYTNLDSGAFFGITCHYDFYDSNRSTIWNFLEYSARQEQGDSPHVMKFIGDHVFYEGGFEAQKEFRAWEDYFGARVSAFFIDSVCDMFANAVIEHQNSADSKKDEHSSKR